MDDELYKRRVNYLTNSRAGYQQVADREERPEQRHTQHRAHLKAGVFASVTGHLAKPDSVEKLLTVGLSHKL